MSGDGSTATGGDGQAADPVAQPPGPASRLRARASGADSVPVTADGGEKDPAAQPPKSAAPSASAAETAAASAAAAGGKPGSRVMTDFSGGADALAAAPGTFVDLAAGADPATGTRLAERPHPIAHGAAALPPGFGHRLAEAVAHFPDRGVELTLSPEELGRVRMMLSTHDGALTLSIQADRPETIDLMRRHIDQLVQDFRDLGFTDVSFSFSRDDTAPGGQRAEREPGDPAAAPAADGAVRDGSAPAGAPRGGLDLRL
jgi:flagellar hook-length control protein FliK